MLARMHACIYVYKHATDVGFLYGGVMDWVLVLIGAADQGVSLATAQFETKELCEAAAAWLRGNVDVNGSPAIAGICFPATAAAE